MQVNEQTVALSQLVRCQQPCQRVNEEALNGTVQVSSPVVLIRTFIQQEFPCFFVDPEKKRPVC